MPFTPRQYNGSEWALPGTVRDMWTTTTGVLPGYSGGGLFRYNETQNRFELIGVHTTTDIWQTPPGSVGIHTAVDTTRVDQWLRDF